MNRLRHNCQIELKKVLLKEIKFYQCQLDMSEGLQGHKKFEGCEESRAVDYCTAFDCMELAINLR